MKCCCASMSGNVSQGVIRDAVAAIRAQCTLQPVCDNRDVYWSGEMSDGRLNLAQTVLCPVHQRLLGAVDAGSAVDAVTEAGGCGFQCVLCGGKLSVLLSCGLTVGGQGFIAAVVQAVSL